MKKLIRLFLTGIFLLVSFSLIWSQSITTSGKTGSNFTPANRATLLYEQLPSGTNTNAYASQEFTDFPLFSCEGADDFIVPAGNNWTIETVTAWGGGWNGFTIGTSIVNVNFYNDNLGQPANVALQSFLAIPCFTDLPGGGVANFIITLPTVVTLPPGHYWLGVAMVGSFALDGQWGRNITATISNNEACWINPGGGFGYGTGWLPASTITPGEADWAFRLEGTSELVAVPLSNWALYIGIGLILVFAIVRFRKMV